MEKKSRKDISSAGMDKKIEVPTWTPKRIAMLLGGILIIAFFVYAFWFMDTRSTLNVDTEKLTVSTVQERSFQESIPLTGTVQPIQTIKLDALEGGVVEKIYIESGTMVEQGDTILALSNSDLQLQVLSRTSGIYDQINQTRNSRLNIEQNTLNLKSQLANAENQLAINRSNYQRLKKLHERDLIAGQEYLEAKENYEYQQKRYEFTYASFKQDSIKVGRQLRQIDQSLDRMDQSLEKVQNILDRLVFRAPIAGQLSTIEMYPGQSIQRGESIGQVDILDRYKVRVGVDEYYLARIRQGLKGTFDYGGQTQQLEITKVYPVVEEGQFKVDMEFINGSPDDLTRGQSLRIRLQLSERSTNAIVLSKGGFYQSTGGNWVFKVVEDGQKAIYQPVELGRQNPEYYEVLSGLQAGDKVITSSYGTFGDNEVLNLE
jgi:HlyD family secretion protein